MKPDTKPFLAYKHIEGKTVLSMLQKSTKPNRNLFKVIFKPINRFFDNPKSYPINNQMAISIMVQLLEMLNYLHSQPNPIIHSDISPENLLLDHQKKLYLIDFGCAKKLNTESIDNPSWIGKPSYLSPEQAKGSNWDHRSDLYQAGIVFYELLCHHKKNSGLNERDARVIAADPPLLNILNIPSYLYEFIKKLLHTDINQRWQSAKECLQELKKIIAKIPNFEENQT